jgi:hypothetical protein
VSHNATASSLEPTSEKTQEAKFAESIFHALP